MVPLSCRSNLAGWLFYILLPFPLETHAFGLKILKWRNLPLSVCQQERGGGARALFDGGGHERGFLSVLNSTDLPIKKNKSLFLVKHFLSSILSVGE
jgi:hypothetical protein